MSQNSGVIGDLVVGAVFASSLIGLHYLKRWMEDGDARIMEESLFSMVRCRPVVWGTFRMFKAELQG